MAIVEKGFDFTETGNDLEDQGNAANITAAQNTTEPSIAFTCTSNNTSQTEDALYQNGDTWETWGVPTGATVNSVAAVWTDRTADASRLTSHSVVLDIVQGDGTTTCLVAPLDSKTLSLTVTGVFASNTGSTISVGAGSQASTQAVRLLASYTLVTPGGKAPSTDWRLGDVDLTIDYTEVGGTSRRIFIVL